MQTVIASHSAEEARPANPPYPGIPAIVDGRRRSPTSRRASREVACAYPITPSTTMAAIYQAAVADGRTEPVGHAARFIEPESEHSSASAAEGFALAGGRVTNFTAGQGLVLMKEVLYVIAGKRLPVVFHVGARALTSQALNIHAGHDDVMAVADTGWGILVRAQRPGGRGPDRDRPTRRRGERDAVLRRARTASSRPTRSRTRCSPRTSCCASSSATRDAHVRDLFDPAEALMTGVVQNQDSYMKGRIGQRAYTDRVPGPRRGDGRVAPPDRPRIRPIDAYRLRGRRRRSSSRWARSPTPRSPSSTTCAQQGRRVGCVAVTVFPAVPRRGARAKPSRSRAHVAVIERTDEPLAAANPLTREIQAALSDAAAEGRSVPRVVSVAAGLGSRDVARGRPRRGLRLARRARRAVRATVRRARHPPPARAASARASTCGPPARTACAATRSAGSAA